MTARRRRGHTPAPGRGHRTRVAPSWHGRCARGPPRPRILPAEVLLRSFEASGARETGTVGLTFVLLCYGSAAEAERGFPRVAAFIKAGAWERAGRADLRRASVPPLGDERVAYAGQVTLERHGRAHAFDLAAVLVRDGALIHALFSVARAGDPLLDVSAVAERVVGRAPGRRSSTGTGCAAAGFGTPCRACRTSRPASCSATNGRWRRRCSSCRSARRRPPRQRAASATLPLDGGPNRSYVLRNARER